ncbi:MAG TPA: NrfD/PsrC family molybdoenzyme membrane anchor subunit [Blastocatellia bacterium]|nr:NrfD/PsrC family molybdoenzyme membrane anchor subunit [Blastocatellia bacterium]
MSQRAKREALTSEESLRPLIKPGHTLTSITNKISAIVLSPPLLTWLQWLIGLGLSFIILMIFMFGVSWVLYRGVGVWGVNIPVAWGFAITNFVWWIGIGHAGTLISAILLLMNQNWRNSINRFAEAMTLFALGCASLFPLLHLGRPEAFYWMLPYPNIMSLWPQFRSPLVWDVFAMIVYGLVSLFFWYLGLVPDLATLRDRTENRLAWVIYGILSLGWRGGSRQWFYYERAYLLLAGLATPLVISVHSIVSFDFSVAIVPGWHSTLFPPYFVAGAAFSGLAMVILIAIPIRYVFGLEDFITMRHFNNLAKLMLALGLIVAYSYVVEYFFRWYSDNTYQSNLTHDQATGAYSWMFWLQITCNALIPQVLWFKQVRSNLRLLFIVSIVISVGMWVERYVIVITSLHRDFLPSVFGMFSGTIWDWATLIGSFGLFLCLMFMFIRLLPGVSMAEMRKLLLHGKMKEES